MVVVFSGIGMTANQFTNTFAEGIHLFGCRIVLHSQKCFDAAVPAGTHIVDRCGSEQTIGQRNERIVESANLRAAKTDCLHTAFHVICENPVADFKRTISEYRERAKKIRKSIFRCQRDGGTPDSHTPDQTGDRQAKGLRGGQNANANHKYLERF